MSRRPFTIPQVLRKGNRAEYEREEEGDEGEDDPTLQVRESFSNGRFNWKRLQLAGTVASINSTCFSVSLFFHMFDK